ncbi:MAG: 4Fe-4S dicluster domain-containing protein [Thermoanaerobaculia bacterium]
MAPASGALRRSAGGALTQDGTLTFQQPLIEPLYGGRSLSEILASFAGRGGTEGYDLLVETHTAGDGAASEETFRRWLHDGLKSESAVAGVAPGPVSSAAVGEASSRISALPAPSGNDLELALRPDPSILDGRFANNGWLQELPKPITKLTWDNAVHLSPRTAERLGMRGEQVVEITTAEGRKASGAVWILPGQEDGVATVHLGYGRTAAGKVAAGAGFSAYELQTAESRWGSSSITLRDTGERMLLATTQGHHAIDWMREETAEAAARSVVKEATLAEFEANPHFVHGEGHELDTSVSFNPGFEYKGYAWGMAIDLGSCTGCNACVVACQAENNIPVVGKEQVARGREMHWIRIDRYFKGDIDAPDAIASQPIVCMQCEQAPCEVVCPVAATVHSTEGLNDMVYNRCVGTRYCANNCPYKVRRFNFLLYQDWDTEQFKLQRNPDVTVRSRGVMEKCTYCVQRINRERIVADRDQKQVADGAIRTACQQACPTRAIHFGNLNDASSEVVAVKKNPRNYALLEELGTRPRTTYLATVRNPNPELV